MGDPTEIVLSRMTVGATPIQLLVADGRSLWQVTRLHVLHKGLIAGIVGYIVPNFSTHVLDLMYKKLGWTIKGQEDYSLEQPDLSMHKAELKTELAGAGGVDDSASGSTLKRKQSAVPLTNPIEDDNTAFYASKPNVTKVNKGTATS